jgi:hypothetical protein
MVVDEPSPLWSEYDEQMAEFPNLGYYNVDQFSDSDSDVDAEIQYHTPSSVCFFVEAHMVPDLLVLLQEPEVMDYDHVGV